jgi:hypothetical protein
MVLNRTRSTFRFLDDIPIDRGHTLDQLTGRFQTIKDGLPELIKNSKDQYSRLGIINGEDRQIAVILNSRRRSLAVLDFAGANPDDFAGWQTWSSRIAQRLDLSADIEAGNGNGGKAFMVRGSISRSYMESCCQGRRTKMGFDNSDSAVRYLPGFAIENGKEVRDVEEREPLQRLRQALERVLKVVSSRSEPFEH